MQPRRSRSLLEFAIAASLAIVPIMLGIVLLVAVLRTADPGTVSWRETPDRYVSVRHVAALRTFEAAIVERSAPALAPPTAQQLLEGLPACRAEWSTGWRASLAQLPGIGTAAPSQAEHIAARLAELDAALLRFGARARSSTPNTSGSDLNSQCFMASLLPVSWIRSA